MGVLDKTQLRPNKGKEKRLMIFYFFFFLFSFWCEEERSWGFPGSSAGKESACNVGDPGSIPRLRRSPREGIDYPLQYSGASPMAQMVKNPPAMWVTWVWSLGQEDPWRRAWQSTPLFLPRESPWTEEPGGLQSMGHKETDVIEWLSAARYREISLSSQVWKMCSVFLIN